MEVNVLGVRSWSFVDEKTGQNKKGITVHYFDPAEQLNNIDERGIFPRKISGDTSLMGDFTKLPAKYTFETKLTASAGGRTGVQLTGVELVS